MIRRDKNTFRSVMQLSYKRSYGKIEDGMEDNPTNKMQAFILGSLMCSTVGGYASWLVYAIAFVSLIFGKSDWVVSWSLPLVQHLNVIAVPMMVLFILLALLPSTRGLGGLFGVLGARVFSLTGTLAALIIVYSQWSTFGIVIGTGLLGFGIIPVGIISSLIEHETTAAITLVTYGASILIGQYGGSALITAWAESENRKAEKIS